MKKKITNIDELRWEIARLTELKREQEAYLGSQYTLLREKVETPTRILGSVTSSIPGVRLFKDLLSSTGKSEKNANLKDSDWLNNTIRLGVPLILSRTVLKKSSWINKALVLLLSETASKQLTKENVNTALSKLATFIRPKKSKKTKGSVVKENVVIQEIIKESPEDEILGI